MAEAALATEPPNSSIALLFNIAARLNHSSGATATMVRYPGGKVSTMVDYCDRLAEAMADAQMSVGELAAQLGISYQAVKKVLDGVSSAFSAANNSAAASILGVNSDWLATGKGPKRSFAVSDNVVTYQVVPPDRFMAIPVIELGAGGTMPERVWDNDNKLIAEFKATAEVASTDKSAFIVKVLGVAMTPKYNPGDFALVEPSASVDIEDDVLVRLTTGQTLLRRLVSQRGGVRLACYNGGEILHFTAEEVSWVYYVAYPVPSKKIKSRLSSL